MDFDAKIKQLGFQLPQAPKPAGAYIPVKKVSGLLFLSGQISKKASGEIITGKVGKDLTLEQAREAALVAALNALAIIKENGGLEQVEGFVRLTGYVQCAPDFYEISKVIDAASNLFFDIWGDDGRHVRSAVGMTSLPLNAAVELELTVSLRGERK